MEALQLFHGLTEAMYESLWQALLIYVFARAVLLLLPWMSADFRYKLLYSALVLCTALFVVKLAMVTMYPPEMLPSAMGTKNILAGPGSFSFKAFFQQHAYNIACIYIAGVILQVLFLLGSFIKLERFKRNGALKVNELWQLKVEHLASTMTITRKVQLFMSEKIISPFTVGYLRPMIIFPMAALNNLTVEQVEAILIHELAHIKRHDYIWNILQRIMEIVLFFNPVTWALSKAISEEREYCCDDKVLQNQSSGISYARALLSLQDFNMNTKLALRATGTKDTLFERIKRITNSEMHSSSTIPRAVVLTAVLASVLFIGWVKPESERKKQEEQARKTTVSSVAKTASQASKITSTSVNIISSRGGNKVILVDTTVQAPGVPDVPVAPENVLPVAPVAPASPVKPIRVLTRVMTSSSSNSDTCQVISGESDIVIVNGKRVNWNSKIAEDKVRDIEKYFQSREWRKKMKNIEKQSANAEKRALAITKRFESKEWESKIERDASEIEKYFSSPEWQSKVERIVENSAQIGEQAAELGVKISEEVLKGLNKRLIRIKTTEKK